MVLDVSEPQQTSGQNATPWIPLRLSPDSRRASVAFDHNPPPSHVLGKPPAVNTTDKPQDIATPADMFSNSTSNGILSAMDSGVSEDIKAQVREDFPENSFLFEGSKLYSGYRSMGPPAFVKDCTTPPNEMEPLEPTKPIAIEISDPVYIPERSELKLHRRCHCHIAAPLTYEPHAPASTRLRYLIKYSERIIDCPGVYDGLSARIAMNVGFPGLYMTGAGTTASRLGAADLGIAQLHDMRSNAEMIANLTATGPPLIADMDTGYGGPIVIAKAVKEYHLAGVAAFHIEDQIMQKRCGHLAGKEVVDIETYIQRIKACKVAARNLRSDIVIIARTDALQSRGYAECIERLRRARDAGAGIISTPFLILNCLLIY